jgi:hypothetical protein
MGRILFFAIFFSFVSLQHASARQGHQVQFELIGSYGYQWTIPIAINDAGVVVGNVGNTGTTAGYNVFLWSSSAGFRTLVTDAVAADINNRGDVVGSRFECVENESGSSCALRGFMWNEGTGFRELGDFSPNAVNDNGDMAGTCINYEHGHVVPCAIRDGVRIVWECDVAKEPCGGEARSINARGDVAGSFNYYNYDGEAVWPRHGGQIVLATDAYASDISNSRITAGAVNSVAAVWMKHREMRESATGDFSQALAINNAGIVVGRTLTYPTKAFVWHPKRGSLTYLSPDAFLSEPTDINDKGDIVGYVDYGDNIYRAAIWRVTDLQPKSK